MYLHLAFMLRSHWRCGPRMPKSCALRCDRPTHPGGIFAAPCASVRLSPSTRERLSLTLDYPDSLIHQYRIPAPAADRCRGAPALPSWCPLAPASVAAQTAPGSRETRAWRTWRTLSPSTHAPAHTNRDSPPFPPKAPHVRLLFKISAPSAPGTTLCGSSPCAWRSWRCWCWFGLGCGKARTCAKRRGALPGLSGARWRTRKGPSAPRDAASEGCKVAFWRTWRTVSE